MAKRRPEFERGWNSHQLNNDRSQLPLHPGLPFTLLVIWRCLKRGGRYGLPALCRATVDKTISPSSINEAARAPMSFFSLYDFALSAYIRVQRHVLIRIAPRVRVPESLPVQPFQVAANCRLRVSSNSHKSTVGRFGGLPDIPEFVRAVGLE